MFSDFTASAFMFKRAPYIRGTIAQLGYKQTGIPYDRSERKRGDSKFRLMALIRLAIDGVCIQSTKPLELITLTGFIFSFLSFLQHFFTSPTTFSLFASRLWDLQRLLF